MPNLEEGGLLAGGGVIVWELFLHISDHLLPIDTV